jgi:trehalose utilization protein
MDPVRVTIWNEHVHERTDPHVAEVYPGGIHGAIATGIAPLGAFRVRTATLEEPEHGLTEEVLTDTDALVWWGHVAHDQVADRVVDRVQDAVLGGMGLVVLHSGHESRIFRRLMGTSCSLRWREAGEHERLWNLRPDHPVLAGIAETVELAAEEMYGEPFAIPEPEELLMIGWFPGGEVFRSLCTWTRGAGRIVYLQPGHETHPTYHHPDILRIVANACGWVAPRMRTDAPRSVHAAAREPSPSASGAATA